MDYKTFSLSKGSIFVSLIPAILLLVVGAAACGIRPSVPLPDTPPVDLHGDTGATVTQRVTLPSPYSKITLTYQGRGNFIVRAHYEEIGYNIPVDDTLVNAIGNYEGVVFVASEEPVLFEVIADDGSWDARIEALGEAENATSWEGKGDRASDFFEPPKGRAWQITHTGASNFIVRVFCLENSQKPPEKLVVSEIGEYTGTMDIEFDGAPCLWIVNADGEWSIHLQE